MKLFIHILSYGDDKNQAPLYLPATQWLGHELLRSARPLNFYQPFSLLATIAKNGDHFKNLVTCPPYAYSCG